MEESNLQVCPRSTNELIQALNAIRENLQVVEDIVHLGLKRLNIRDCNTTSTNGGEKSGSSRCSPGNRINTITDSSSTSRFDSYEAQVAALTEQLTTIDVDIVNNRHHLKSHVFDPTTSHSGCSICMLRTSRLPLEKNVKVSTTTSAKKRAVKPRLNKTASLRRENSERRAHQEQQMTNTSQTTSLLQKGIF